MPKDTATPMTHALPSSRRGGMNGLRVLTSQHSIAPAPPPGRHDQRVPSCTSSDVRSSSTSSRADQSANAQEIPGLAEALAWPEPA
jgi:hypothetical protein